MQDYEAVTPEPETAELPYHQCEAERTVDPHFAIEEDGGGDDGGEAQVSEPPAGPPP